MRIVWQTVRRSSNDILRATGSVKWSLVSSVESRVILISTSVLEILFRRVRLKKVSMSK